MVRPKKVLGQHFLKDQGIARKIVDALILEEPKNRVLEIGPGTGVLTAYLLQKPGVELSVAEIDRESIAYLREHFPELAILEGDFLEQGQEAFGTGDLLIIGNFPYNISSQIFFKILDHRHQVSQIVCMLQKEVAERLASPPGNKTYGILSVFLQTYYTIELLFKVPPGVFFPPPKVMSAVIRLVRNDRDGLACDEALFRKVVKQGFQNRRKTLRNALKNLNLPASISGLSVFDKRAEQLTPDDFISLTTLIERAGEGPGRI